MRASVIQNSNEVLRPACWNKAGCLFGLLLINIDGYIFVVFGQPMVLHLTGDGYTNTCCSIPGCQVISSLIGSLIFLLTVNAALINKTMVCRVCRRLLMDELRASIGSAVEEIGSGPDTGLVTAQVKVNHIARQGDVQVREELVGSVLGAATVDMAATALTRLLFFHANAPVYGSLLLPPF